METMTVFDLDAFCDHDGAVAAHYDLPKPFIFNGFQCATDGRIAVMIPADGEPNTVPSDGKRFPDAPRLLMSAHSKVKEWSPWPTAAEMIANDKQNPCAWCHGSRSMGRGECCDCLQLCMRCMGTGVELRTIGAVNIAAKYEEEIRDLPGIVEWANGEDCVVFRCGVLLGCVMALVPASDNELS